MTAEVAKLQTEVAKLQNKVESLTIVFETTDALYKDACKKLEAYEKKYGKVI